jgi:hypothetical protein
MKSEQKKIIKSKISNLMTDLKVLNQEKISQIHKKLKMEEDQ